MGDYMGSLHITADRQTTARFFVSIRTGAAFRCCFVFTIQPIICNYRGRLCSAEAMGCSMAPPKPAATAPIMGELFFHSGRTGLSWPSCLFLELGPIPRERLTGLWKARMDGCMARPWL